MSVTANLTSPFAAAIQGLDESIVKMTTELTENMKRADSVLLQLKAIFATEKINFEIKPPPQPNA